MPTHLSVDFETYSKINLQASGLIAYSEDESTGCHCMSYGFDQSMIRIWKEGEPFPELIRDHLDEGGIISAWNANFELALWNNVCAKKYGWPTLPLEQVECTMARSFAMSLPGSLEKAAPALGLDVAKDQRGKKVMLRLCQPKPDGTMWSYEDDPDAFEQLYAYCQTDTEVELAISARLQRLSETEQKAWQMDSRINAYGFMVDTPTVEKAIKTVEVERLRLNAEMLETTGGEVGSCTEVQMLVAWIREQGVEIDGVAKSDVIDALSGELPANVRKALELRKEAAKSSLAKLKAFQEGTTKSGRFCGSLQYHGASTGRWAGRKIQIQNFPRGRAGTRPEDVEDIIAHIDDRDYLELIHGPVNDAISDSLRGMIIAPPGYDLISADFSSIEGRVLAWLAGENWKVQAYREFDNGVGPDIYRLSYSKSFGIPVEKVGKDQRQIGKVAELALGFGGGVGAFGAMAKNYGISLPDSRAEEIKKAWRAAHPFTTRYWYDLESAAIQAVETGGVQRVGKVAYRKRGSFLWGRLPSGRVICYPYPQIREVDTPWGEKKFALTYMTNVSNLKAKTIPDEASSGTWQRIVATPGHLAENVTQATARDILLEAMFRLDAQKAKIVFTVHDEIALEVPETAPEPILEKVCGIMSTPPDWAKDLPLAAEGFRAKRYRK